MIAESSRAFLGRVAAIAVLAFGFGPGHAATIDIKLAGIVGNGSYFQSDAGGYHFDQWGVSLSGFAPFTVSAGDTINATVVLDESITIPASDQLTFFAFGLSGPSFPAGDTSTSGSTAFFLGGAAGAAGAASSTAGLGWLYNGVVFFPPDNGAITFDTFVSSFSVDTLSAQVELDTAYAFYTLVSQVKSVPEPNTAALVLLAALGFVRRGPRGRKSR